MDLRRLEEPGKRKMAILKEKKIVYLGRDKTGIILTKHYIVYTVVVDSMQTHKNQYNITWKRVINGYR